MGSPILDIRRSRYRLIFNVGVPILVRRQKAANIYLYGSIDGVRHPKSRNPFVEIKISGVALGWFNNYLTNITQFVELDHNALSSRKYITTGVPQGLFLTPGCF